MDQKILVAFDDSENAMRAVDFIAKNFKATGHVTLLSIIQDTESLCAMNSPELTPYFKSEQSNFCYLEEKKKELVQDAMERAKSILIGGVFSEKNIETKIQTKEHGIAQGIIKESQSGYDILAMGRRGVSGVKEFFLGSVSQKVFNHAKDISIVLVN
jgi:nucleotide-binding universal stress UspA family protein